MTARRTAPHRWLSCCLVLSVGLAWSPAAAAQRGGLAIQQNLAELVDHAGTIVRGHVVNARVEPHPDFTHLHTVVVTVRVQETLKGEAGESFVFRQYIWDIRDRYDAAGYRKGGELLLFLTRPSEVGLSSPVGLGQGRFRVVRGPGKEESAVNGVGNYGLFRDLLPALRARGVPLSQEQVRWVGGHSAGPVGLEDLTELIRLIAGRN